MLVAMLNEKPFRAIARAFLLSCLWRCAGRWRPNGMQLGCRSAHEFPASKRPFPHYGFFCSTLGEKGCTPNNGFYMLIFSIKMDVNCRFSCAGRCCGRKAGMWRRRHGKFRPLGKETETGVYWMPVACPMVMRVLSAINLL